MKNAIKVLGLVTLAVIVSLGFIACDNGGNNNNTGGPASTTYNSTDTAGNQYKLVITEDGARAAAAGDSYTLTITFQAGGVSTSKGKVSSVGTGGAFTLQPNNSGAAPFTVTVSGTGISAIAGAIAVEEGEPVPAPTFPQGNNNNGGEEGDPSLWTYSENREWDADLGNWVSLGNVTIYRYLGTETAVTIPAQIDGKPVVGIYGTWDRDGTPIGIFSDPAVYPYTNTVITSVTIPDSVTSIGDGAFVFCTGLASVTFEWAGLSINGAGFPNQESLQTAYTAGGIGTYTHTPPNGDWTKQ